VSKYVEVKFNLLPGLEKQLDREIPLAVSKTAFFVELGAESRGRRRTGAMRAGWYRVTSKESNYDQAVDAGLGMNPDAEVVGPVPTPSDNLTAYVSNAFGHTFYNEFGTSAMPADPMARPAAEEQREPFKKRIFVALTTLGK
jgi:hypothetical protein